jgi:hypothetical protein
MNSKKVRKVATSKHDRNGRDLKQRWEEILKKAEQSAKVRIGWNELVFKDSQQIAKDLLSWVFLYFKVLILCISSRHEIIRAWKYSSTHS